MSEFGGLPQQQPARQRGIHSASQKDRSFLSQTPRNETMNTSQHQSSAGSGTQRSRAGARSVRADGSASNLSKAAGISRTSALLTEVAGI